MLNGMKDELQNHLIKVMYKKLSNYSKKKERRIDWALIVPFGFTMTNDDLNERKDFSPYEPNS
jgi:hypothetical protein